MDEAALIQLGTAEGDVIVFLRCLDESDRVVTLNDEYQEQSPQIEEPHVYTVRLVRRPSEDWWRSDVTEQGPTC